MNILAISGSLKQSSANSALVRAFAAAQPERVEIWDELGELPHFTPDDDGGNPVASLRAAVTRADAVLVATPEYAGGMPGSLKNALDWLVGTGELYDKPVAIVSAAPSPERGENARRWVEDVVGYQGGHVVASFTVTKDEDPRALLTPHRRRARRSTLTLTDARAAASPSRASLPPLRRQPAMRARNSASASRVTRPSSTTVMPSARGSTVISSPAPTSPSRTMRR